MARLVTLTLAVAVALDVSAVSAQNNGRASSNVPSMTGVVKAVSASTVTLELGGNDILFRIDSSTVIVARGKALTDDLVYRGPRKLTNYVKAGDRVTVTYRQSGGALTIVQLRFVQK